MTARDLDRMKRKPEDVTALARDALLGKILVTADKNAIKSAFYMMLALTEMTEAASRRIGALIGYYEDAVPGRAMNGYPIFTSMGFLHKADVDFYDAEMARLRLALGLPVAEAQEEA